MTVHFVLRVPLMTRIHGRSFNTIEAHNEAVNNAGRVALAKFGKPGTVERCERLRKQIAGGDATLLILVAKRGERFLGFQSRISSIHHGKPDEIILDTAPKYYRDLDETAYLWFTMNHPFVPCGLKNFRLSTNPRPLLDVMRECRTSSMLVEERP